MRKAFATRRLYNHKGRLEAVLSGILGFAMAYLLIASLPRLVMFLLAVNQARASF